MDLKRKVPQFLGDTPIVLCLLPEIVAFRALPADMLDHARGERPAGLAMLVGILLGQHVHEADLLRLVPCDQGLGLVSRKDEALGAASEVVHLVDAGWEREHGDFAGGEEEDDAEGNADDACDEEVAAGKIGLRGRVWREQRAEGEKTEEGDGDRENRAEEIGWPVLGVPPEELLSVEESEIEDCSDVSYRHRLDEGHEQSDEARLSALWSSARSSASLVRWNQPSSATTSSSSIAMYGVPASKHALSK